MPKGLSTQRSRIAAVSQILRVDDLSGGLELRQSPSLLKPAQARLLRNWSLQEPGALVTYPGWMTWSTSSLGARRAQGGQRCYLQALTFSLFADNGSVYKPTDGGVIGAAVLSGLHATNQVHFPHDQTLAAAFDGSGVPQKTTDGTTWSQMGIAAPATPPTGSAAAGGSLITASTYEASYSYQDDELSAEGNESATVQQLMTSPNLTFRLGVTASADPQVDKINVYVRNVTAGETVRRYYATIANTTGTTDITSNTWTSGREAPTDHTVPPAGLVHAIPWKNRWWAWVGRRLYFTQIFENQSWSAFFYIDIPFERGDEIAACAAQGDTFTVFGKASKPFVIIGQTSLDFEVRPALGAQAGAFGPRAIEVIENGIVHAAAEGVYIFDGSSDRLLSYNIDPGWQDLVQGSSATDLARVAVVYHGLRKELRIGVPRLYPFGEPGTWVLDLNRTRTQEIPAWTSLDRPNGGFIHWNGNESTLGNRGRLFTWPSTPDARLYEEATGATADGGDMIADAEMSTHASGGYETQFCEAFVEFQPAAGTLSVTPYVDGVSKGSQNVLISTGLLPWGSAAAPYGTASRLYGGRGRAQRPLVLPMSCEGRTLAFRFRYSGRQTFKLFTYAIDLTPESAMSGI